MKQAQLVQIPYEKTFKTFPLDTSKNRYNYKTIKTLNFRNLSNICFHTTIIEINV